MIIYYQTHIFNYAKLFTYTEWLDLFILDYLIKGFEGRTSKFHFHILLKLFEYSWNFRMTIQHFSSTDVQFNI